MFIVIVGEEGGRASDLQLALRDLGLDWTVHWLTDAGGALTIPRERQVDVLVAEMQIGTLAGTALLEQARSLHPEATRILLLDRGNGTDALAALDVAHPSPTSVRPSITADELARSMDEAGEGHVVVSTLDGVLIGIVERADLVIDR